MGRRIGGPGAAVPEICLAGVFLRVPVAASGRPDDQIKGRACNVLIDGGRIGDIFQSGKCSGQLGTGAVIDQIVTRAGREAGLIADRDDGFVAGAAGNREAHGAGVGDVTPYMP